MTFSLRDFCEPGDTYVDFVAGTREVIPHTVTVRIENTYEDGHESTQDHELDAPEDPENLEDWWEDYVWELTGDGHGAKHPKLGSLHEATIIRADDEQLVGQKMEW